MDEFEKSLAQSIKEAEKNIEKLKEEIDKAERAGIDVAELRMKYEDAKMKIARIKSVYFPKGLPKEG